MNVKKGDLAYIVEGCIENIGAVIEVIDAYGIYLDDGFCWNIRSFRPLLATGTIDGKLHFVTEGFITDRSLRPISGVPIDDEVIEELKEPA